MDPNALYFDKDKLNRFFPFYILIGHDLTISSCGDTVKKLKENCEGDCFKNSFQITRPFVELVDFSSLQKITGQLVTIQINNQQKNILRGQFEFIEKSDQILFIGSPWFNSIEELTGSELTLNDFAVHDPLIDLLHVFKMQEIVNEDLKGLLQTVNKQKNELKKVSEEFKDIALFPMQNPDPLYRIAIDGTILMQNPAAEKLASFFYKDRLFASADFWKFISEQREYLTDHWSFEVNSGVKIYSFVCRHLPDFKYFNVYGREITNQKNTEEELQRLSLLASGNNNGVIFNDAKGYITWANNSYCKLLGYPLEEIIGKFTLDFCTGPLTNESILQKIREGIGIDESFNKELIHYRKDGTWFWGRVRGQAYKSANDKEIQYFSTLEDISVEKGKSEELLRLSLLASANENGVIFTHTDGRIFWVNDGFCKLTGFSPDEIIGQTPVELCSGPLTDPGSLKIMIDLFRNGESFDVELIHYRKDGTWFWGRAKGQSYKTEDGQNIQYFATVEDISQDKQKEERLKVLSKIAENNINGVIITDSLGKITWVNTSFTQLTGYSLEEAMGRKPGHLLQGPDTDPKTVAYLRKQIIEGKPFSADVYNYSKFGKPYWLRIKGQPIHNSNGDLTGFFALEEDITKEREIQQRINETEARFKLALEKIGDSVWEHDLMTGKTVFSKANDQLWGFNSDEYEDEGILWFKQVYAGDLRLLKHFFNLYTLKEIDSHNLEYRIIHKDGEVRWVLDRGVVTEKDAGGNALKIVGTQTDITKIKQTERELGQRVKQFKSLSENIPGVIYEYEFRDDGTEGFSYISPAMETVFGIKPADFINYPQYLHPDDRQRVMQKNEHSKNTLEPFYDESRLIIPGGGLRWIAVQSSFSYTSQNNSKVFTGFLMDITKRKNSEDILKTNEEKYRSIIANMKLGLLEVDIKGNATYANNSFCDMSGYTLSELIGENAAQLLSSEKNRELVEEKSKIRERGISDAYEIETKNKKGEKKWWLISGAPRYNDKGELVGSIGIHLDITEQKKQERELIEARNQAQQFAQTKDTFLANMSHEIRTPMNAIMGMSNQLAKTPLSTNQKFYLDTILSASDNLLIIINDILDLSKIEAGKLSIENIGFEFNTTINNAIRVVKHKAEEKGLRVSCSFFDNNISPVLIGDPHRLNQVLLNLMTNAIKFTEHGSVDLLCTIIKDSPVSQLIKVDVKDTGIGMDEAFVKVLFEKFSQEYESVSRRFGGTGLGMSICKELVTLMGGHIFVESKKGQGTTISFTIEFSKGSNADLPEKFMTQYSSDFLKGRKVLVTDDNELNRIVASIILENYGATVLMAENGEKSIEMIDLESPDVVLMDIQMPVMNGFETAKAIRASGNTIPIIALTAAAIKGEREKCFQSGMNDYITKPFKEEELLKLIERCLHGENFHMIETESVTEPGATHEALYDLSMLRDISRGNEAFVAKMIDVFCEQTPPLIEEMIKAYTDGNYEQMGSLAHKIKPSIDNLKIESLKQVVRDIEIIGRENRDDAGLPAMLGHTKNILLEVTKK
ncbi:Autoinducer 2 sensor kinase/phosphatase LuxQ [Mucilaginibacter gotjawali]|nr:PAS domain S-box protein [Mucilaginibacter gotjawali]BAU54883.1 Autoinducer 2 sensor kinase/phosphatase LuxQ [Mucilaginibacter gotjawali]